MTNVNVNVVRRMTFYYLSPACAGAADMTLQELQRFLSGSYRPTEQQLRIAGYRG
jgi:hypothetical protein